MRKKFLKIANRCPMTKTVLDNVRTCFITVRKTDNSSQVIRTHPAFLQLEKGERIETKVSILAHHVCGYAENLESFDYQVN